MLSKQALWLQSLRAEMHFKPIDRRLARANLQLDSMTACRTIPAFKKKDRSNFATRLQAGVDIVFCLN